MKKTILLVLVVLGLTLSGCGGGGSSSTVTPQEVNFYPDAKIVNTGSYIEPAVETVVLDDDSNLQLDEASVTYNTLTFSASDGTVPTIQVGQVLAGLQGETGFLRKVTAVTIVGDTVTVTTEPATMAEAFENADISISIPLLDYATDQPPVGTDLTPISAVSTTVSKTIYQKLEYKPNNYASASGSILIYDIFDFNFDGSIRSKKFTSMNITNKMLVKNTFEVKIVVPAAMSANPEQPFAAIYNKTFVANIGGVPVPVKVKVTPVLGVNMDFKGSFDSSASYVYSNLITSGLNFDGTTFTPIKDRKETRSVPEPVFGYSGNASAKGYVNAVLTIAFYEWIGGPGIDFGMGPYSEMTASVVSANLTQPTTCSSTFNLGFDGTLKADLGAFDGLLSDEQKTWTLFDLKYSPPVWTDDACPFNIDPVINTFIATPAGGNPSLDVTFNFAVSDANADTLICSIDYDGNGVDDDDIDCSAGSGTLSHTYDTPGTYPARLTVIDTEGAQMTETAAISVVLGPVAPSVVSFSATPTSGKEPLDVQFNYEVHDDNGDQMTCNFDFDGNGISDRTVDNCASGMVSHTFTTVGNFAAVMTVTDGTESSTGTQTIVVSSAVNTPPVVDSFSASPNPGVIPFDLAIDYQVSDADGDYLTCTIAVDGDDTAFPAMNDCSSGTIVTPVNGTGSFVLEIMVDDGVNQATDSVILVSNGAATGSIQGTITAPGGLPVVGASISLNSYADIDSTITDADGNYAFAAVPVGTYFLVLTKSGYSGVTINDVVVTAGSILTVDKVMNTASAPSANFSGTGEFADDEYNYWTVDVTMAFNSDGTLAGVVGGTVYFNADNFTAPLAGSFNGTWVDGSFDSSGSVMIMNGNTVAETIPFTYGGSISNLDAQTISGTIRSSGSALVTFTGNRVSN